MKHTVFSICFCAVACVLAGCQQKTARISPAQIIFDTDMGPDYDDVGAIAVLHALADRGEVNILGTVASTRYEGVAAVINLLNTWYGRPDIPIGVPKHYAALNLRDWQFWSDSLRSRYFHKIRTNDEADDAVELYRRLLSFEPDTSVTIITVGFLTNLSVLLQSKPDQYSDLDGVSLVKKKVKRLVSMAGRFPAGLEFNIEEDATSAKYAFEHWPTPVIFSGFEIGAPVRTGLKLSRDRTDASPIKDVYRICIPLAAEDSLGRMSWDQTAVLAAVRGAEFYFRTQRGRIIIEANGSNRWVKDDTGRHQYLIQAMSPDSLAVIIDELMMHP